jgi:hypothetical protein
MTTGQSAFITLIYRLLPHPKGPEHFYALGFVYAHYPQFLALPATTS